MGILIMVPSMLEQVHLDCLAASQVLLSHSMIWHGRSRLLHADELATETENETTVDMSMLYYSTQHVSSGIGTRATVVERPLSTNSR